MLAKRIRDTLPKHPFTDNYDPGIMNAILAYHSWTTQQHLQINTASDDPRE